MALGSSWGTREEMLHPRDRRGRFRKKWSMPEGLVNKLQAFLGRFSPRTFQSDNQASQYLANRAKPGRFAGDGEQRLRFDWDEANDHLRAGDIDPSTQKFIQMMDRAEVAMPEQLILHRTVGPEAFGLTAEQLALEEGGLEDFTGRLIADRAYSATNLGTPMGLGPGRIHMTIATPRGQKAIIPAQAPSDRGVILPRDQGIRITRVRPDGRGGWDVMAIAEPKGVSDQTPEPVMPGRRGAGLSEAQREERLRPTPMTQQQRLEAAGNPPTAQRAAEQRGEVPAAAAQPAAPAPPAAGVPERREPVQKETIGPAATEGTSPGEIADSGRKMVEAEAQQQATPAPATPASFAEAVGNSDLKAPSRGPRQKEFNDALAGIVNGRTTPQDALRQLETDIEVNKRKLERVEAGQEKPDPELAQDIKDQEALADLISSHHGVARRGQAAQAETPEAPAAPAKVAKKAAKAAPTKAPAKKAGAGPKPTPGAPSTSRESVPSPKVQEERGLDRMTRPELLAEAGMKSSRMNKEQLREIVRAKRDSGTAPPAPAPAKKAPGSKFTPAQEEALVNRAKQFRGKERNDEERRIVAEADAIEARGKAPAKKAAKKAAPETDLDRMGEIAERVAARKAEDREKMTPEFAEPTKKAAAKKAAAKKAAPEKMVPGDQRVPDTESPAVRQANESLRAVAKKATPAKAAPTPEDAAEEAFKARVAEAGLPDRVTALRAMAKDQKIRGFSTMNKRQLQSALLGDEVPRAGKIGAVPPARLVPHLEAADSDQEARKLLANHTLADLKELAKHRELEIPKKGATKPRLTDMVLEDIRGPQEGIQGRTPETGLEEDLANLGYISLPGANGDAINREIDQTQPDSPEALRQHRDNLEALSRQFRKDGDKDAANMAQAAADAMGMRAQTISGVEEAAPPVKRVAKKAAPELPEGEAPETERPIEKMLKPELLALAQREGASEVRPSWSKARILEEIKKNRRMDSGRGGETEEDRLRRGLEALPGGPERDLGPTQGPLQLPNRAPTPEEIARDAGETPAPAKKATKKAAKKAVADVDRAAETVSGQLKGTFGDQLKGMDPEEMRQAARTAGVELGDGNTAEEIFDNTIKKMLESRMRELGMLPEDPKKPTKAQKRVPKGSVKGPKADVPIATQDRRDSFTEAWDKQNLGDDASTIEVRDRIASGEFTHEEGVRRLESEIAFNEEEISDLGAELRGMAPEDRDSADGIYARRAELQDKITAQKKAVKFLRTHAKNEAPVTRQELEEKLPDVDKAALQRVEVDDLKAAAKAEGLGNIEGDDRDTVVANIARAMQAREAKNLEREQRARDRQAEADQKVGGAQVIANIEDVMDGSNRAIQTRIQTMRRSGAISKERETTLQGAFIDGGREGLQKALDQMANEVGLRRRDKRGDKTHFDPERHELPPGSGIKKGDPVTVLGPGFRSDVQGDDIQVHKARVTAGHEEAPSAPTGVSTPEQPPVKAAPGTAAGRITTARLTPGTRLLVEKADTEGLVRPTTRKTGSIPVTVTSVEGVRRDGPRSRGMYRVTVTDDDGNVLKLGDRGASQTHMLEPPPKAAKVAKAATPAPARRDTQDLLGELINDDNPMSREEVGARIADLDRAQLQEMAKALNIPAGSRRTIPDTRRSIVEATVGRRLDSIAIRGFRGDRPGAPEPDLPEGAPARVLAESHQVTSTPLRLPSVAPKASDPEGPKRHNAELIGAGLDIDRKGEDRQWMDVVQADLDRGIDGRQIADGLRREADTTRTLRNIGDAVGQTSDPGPAGQIERMERMADRLEAVRPIAKPVGQSKLADQGRKDMSTMSAASAQSKAFQDLKAGKSHTEVATALRQAATSVGSRDHDVQPVRVQDFTPAERTAMKRSDAKKLRELAAEIQAQGVAQRAEARAAKKAPTKSHLRPDSGAAVLSEDSAIRAQAKKATSARQAARAAKAQAEFVDRMAGERAAFKGLGDKTPEQDRKDLTGTTGELATAAIDAGLERLQAASTPEQENDAFKGILLPELKTMADRLGLKTSGTKAALMQRIADRVKGREAPTTSAERAVPKVEAPSAGAVDESVPLDKFPHDDNMRMHADSPTMELAFAYEKAGRNGSANRMAKLRARTTTPSKGSERLTPQQLVEELRAMRAQETDPKFQRMLDRAIAANDAPMTPLPEIPADTPPLARQLLEDLHAIPYARKGPGSEGGSGLTHGPSLVDQLAEVYRDAGRGERGPERRHPVDRIRAILRNKIHELNDPSFRIWEMAGRFESDESSDTGKKVTELEKQIRDWERSHWPR